MTLTPCDVMPPCDDDDAKLLERYLECLRLFMPRATKQAPALIQVLGNNYLLDEAERLQYVAWGVDFGDSPPPVGAWRLSSMSSTFYCAYGAFVTTPGGSVHMVGSCYATIDRSTAYVTLQILAVHPAYRRRGIGSQLLRQVETTARRDVRRSINGLQLSCIHDDVAARAFYEKSLFRVALADGSGYMRLVKNMA